MALTKLYYFYSKEKQIDYLVYAKVVEVKCLATEERSRVLKAQVTALARLLYLKKVYKNVYLKEYCFIK